MSEVIYKYGLDITLGQSIEMPSGARLLHVGEQQGRLIVWALVNPDAEPFAHTISVIGTGWTESTISGVHVGTVQMGSGLVWHVFDG